MQHVLYDDSDVDAPNAIKDSHGQVVLDMCKLCGRAEIELLEVEDCEGHTEQS